MTHKLEDLGEVIEGDRMVNTPYDVRFQVLASRLVGKKTFFPSPVSPPLSLWL